MSSTKRIIELITKLDDKGLEELEAGLKKVDKSQKDLENQSKKTGKTLKDDFRGGQAAADRLSSGVSGVGEQFVIVAKAAKKGGQAMRSAMIATGVGALIVALGVIVDNWELIAETLGFINKDLERQHALLETNISFLDSELSLLDRQIKFNKDRNLSNKENLKKQKELLNVKKELIAEDIKILEAQLLKEESAAREFTLWERIQEFLPGWTGRQIGGFIDEEEQKRISEIRKQILKLQEEAIIVDDKLDPIDPDTSTGRDKLTSINPLTSKDVDKRVEEEVALFEYIFDVKKTNAERLKELSSQTNADILENDTITNLLRGKQEREYQESLEKSRKQDLIQEKILNAQKVELSKQALMSISNVLGETSAAGKAVAVATSLINTYQGITAELATKTATPFEFALKVANIASVTAIGFKSVKDILATKLPSFASDKGGGSGGASASAPSFNVVGQSGVNQLAQSLGQDQQPIQAFVVGSQVTTQQQLDNNIVETATLG